MKTKKAVVVGASLFFALLLFSGTASAATTHKVVLSGLVVDSTMADTTVNTIYAHKGSTNYTITVPNKKNALRGKNVKIELSDIYNGDIIRVQGKTGNGTSIDASQVKDTSIQKITGLHIAEILGKGPADEISVFIQSSKKRVVEIVMVYHYTKIIDGKRRKTFADLQAGDVVNLKGIWNTNIRVIYNTTKIKIRRHSMLPDMEPGGPGGLVVVD